MRLPEYDYGGAGTYFVTFCVKGRRCLLGTVVGRDAPGAPPSVCLSETGRLVEDQLLRSEQAYPGLSLHKYVIMPNHVHMLFSIENGAPGASRPTQMVPRMVAAIKRLSNQRAGMRLWQTSYHDHVIRDENDFLRHWNYIDANPIRWAEDEYFCETM